MTSKVSLPDDIRAGDTISGTVIAEPKGKDAKEKKENLDRLDAYVVDIANRSAKVSSGKIENIKLPDGAQNAELILSDEKGKQLARALMALGRLAAAGASDRFSFPELGQSGMPFPINGSFDGNSANTTVKIRDASTTSVSLSGPYRDEESRRASYGFQFISQKTGTDIKEFGVMFGMDAEKCAWSCQLIAEGVVREFRTDPTVMSFSPNVLLGSHLHGKRSASLGAWHR